jgi:hypothetical protein
MHNQTMYHLECLVLMFRSVQQKLSTVSQIRSNRIKISLEIMNKSGVYEKKRGIKDRTLS